jgi:2-oxoglutarate dehydrogenase complex dehydrogenase (E1) component-like enzyme
MSGLDFVTRANADYVEEQYRRYRAGPSSVDEHWALFFAGFEQAVTFLVRVKERREDPVRLLLEVRWLRPAST